jgi:hypothetical protein
MKIKTLIIILVTHTCAGAVGFAAGIYALPIITAPPAPSSELISEMSEGAAYQAEFIKDLQDSDFLHQAQGAVTVGSDYITFVGNMSPGPDYKLYLSPEFVETEADFLRLKSSMTQVGEVKTFDNFVVAVDDNTDIEQFNTVVVWCESFGEFITAAQYR